MASPRMPADEDTTSSPPTSCCQWAKPKFLTKLEMCLEGIQHNMYENRSDFSVDLVQVDVVERQQPTIVRLLRWSNLHACSIPLTGCWDTESGTRRISPLPDLFSSKLGSGLPIKMNFKKRFPSQSTTLIPITIVSR
mmetsp:Transcript_11136/g.24822  ORF Transcript_11136/g.24822 Transcript_11136/m.24822 type:complete len:137 (+) Transcript_11136:504-914(+)